MASVGCGLAPTGEVLILARVVQGIGGALLVPSSLAMIETVIRAEDRGRAIGVWAGLSGVSSAIGPFVGGWLVDAASWRWVFLINVPLAAVALLLTIRHVPRIRDARVRGPLDVAGAVSVTIGLGGVTFALIEAPVQGWTPTVVAALVVGVLAVAAFPFVEHRAADPLVPLRLFRSPQFSGTNVVTLAVYTGLGGALFLLAAPAGEPGLQRAPGRPGVRAVHGDHAGPLRPDGCPGAADRAPCTDDGGSTGRRGGARAAGPGRPRRDLLGRGAPGILVFGLGMAMTVAPLTATVLAAVPAEYVGAASGANNAISRFASPLAVAVLPLAVGITDPSGASLQDGFGRAMLVSAALCVVGGAVAWATVRNPAETAQALA